MTVLNNVTIETKEAERLVNTYQDQKKLNHLISTLLTQEAIKRFSTPQQRPQEPKKNKWAKLADKIEANPTLDDETAEHLLKCSKEFREGFVMRDVDELMNNNEQ